MRLSRPPARRRVRALLSAVLLGTALPLAALTAPPVVAAAPTAPPHTAGPPARAVPVVDATGADAPFHPGTTPYSRSASSVSGKTPSASTYTPLTTMAAPAPVSTDRLTVSTSPQSIEDYWYWAAGVQLTVSGMSGSQRAVIEDHAPDGSVEIFDPAQSDADGDLSVLIKSATYLPVVGLHTLVVTAADGSTGRTYLDVKTYQARDLTLSVSPGSITRQAWRTSPVTVTARGFSPNERVLLFLFTPDGTGQQVGVNEGLRADAHGVFTYQLQASSAAVQFGTWSVTVMDSSFDLDGSVATDFTVLEGARSRAVGTMTARPAVLTDAALGLDGVTYSATGLKRWDVMRVTLRTPRGIDYYLGRFRASSNGRLSSSVTSSGSVPPGVYTITAQSDLTSNVTAATFRVVPADGSTPTIPQATASATRISRLQLLDHDQGIRVSVAGYDPGQSVEVLLVDRTQQVLRLASTSVAVTTVGPDGRAQLRVSSRNTAPTGDYEIRVVEYSTDPIVLRLPLTVTG